MSACSNSSRRVVSSVCSLRRGQAMAAVSVRQASSSTSTSANFSIYRWDPEQEAKPRMQVHTILSDKITSLHCSTLFFTAFIKITPHIQQKMGNFLVKRGTAYRVLRFAEISP